MTKHKLHRGLSAHKRDIILLTCIFRLRFQPSVPYPLISDIFLDTLPNIVTRLTQKERLEEGQLLGWLEANFIEEEAKASKQWAMAKVWNKEVVGEMLQNLGLGEKGYTLVEDGEMEVQIKWRRDGDWRAESIPENTWIYKKSPAFPTGLKGDEQTRKSDLRYLSNSVGALGPPNSTTSLGELGQLLGLDSTGLESIHQLIKRLSKLDAGDRSIHLQTATKIQCNEHIAKGSLKSWSDLYNR